MLSNVSNLIIRAMNIIAKITFIFFFGILSLNGLFAQVENSGFVKFEISDIQSDNPQMESMLSAMKGGTMDVYFFSFQSNGWTWI